MTPNQQPWKISLHGGHSGEFCEHAVGRLRDVLEAAVNYGYSVFGVSEHAPRSEERFVYETEREKGFDVARLRSDFENYAVASRRLVDEFAPRLTVLRGFEAEVVPAASFQEEMLGHRERHAFDYMVGSVHYVEEIPIDGPLPDFRRALAACDGLENLAVRYYDLVASMVESLRPEAVGHLDLIRKNAPRDADLQTPRIRAAAERALEAVRAHGATLDLNTAGWRKGLDSPYPAPWLVRRAAELGIPFCFGDDSHGPQDVGAGVAEAREYLLRNGVSAIRGPRPRDGAILWETIPLA